MANALSDAVTALRTLLHQQMSFDEDKIRVGHPERVEKRLSARAGEQFLDIFVYHVEHAGHPASVRKDEPFYVRVHCLLVPMTIPEDDEDEGLGDLQLLGRVMEALHRQPSLRVPNGAGGVLADLQIVPTPMTQEEASRIWGAHSDHEYRVSAAYELALLPVFAHQIPPPAPRVAEIVLGLSLLDQSSSREAQAQGPAVSPAEIDFERPDWVPRVYLLDANDRLALARFEQRVAGQALPSTRVLGFGRGAGTLAIERWDSASGWTELGGAPTIEFLDARVEPGKAYDDIEAADRTIQVPLDNALATSTGQVWIRARRVWQRPDGANVTLMSNAVLVTVQGAP